MKQLTSSHPFESIHLIHNIPTEDTVKLEKAFHSCFEHKKVKGEWFQLTREDIECIQQVKEI
jgi:hypothetical protein